VPARSSFPFAVRDLSCTVADSGLTVGLIESRLEGRPLSERVTSVQRDRPLTTIAEVAAAVHAIAPAAFRIWSAAATARHR